MDLTGVTSLLDVGCGDGRVTQSLAERVPGGPCVGIDPSPGMIAVAPASGNLTFEVDAVETMRFDDEFDLVVSFNALHWVTDQRRALRCSDGPARRRAGGAGVRVRGSAAQRRGRRHVGHGDAALEGLVRGVLGAVRAPGSRAMAKGCEVYGGFGVEDVRVDDLSWDFGSRDAFATWCAVGFGGWTGDLTSEEGSAFVDQVVDAYAEATGSDHVFRFMQLVGKLTKP